MNYKIIIVTQAINRNISLALAIEEFLGASVSSGMTFKCKEIRSGPSYESRSSAFCRFKDSRLNYPFFFHLGGACKWHSAVGRRASRKADHRCFALDARAWVACVIKHRNLRYKNDFGFAGESDRVWPLRDIGLYIVYAFVYTWLRRNIFVVLSLRLFFRQFFPRFNVFT